MPARDQAFLTLLLFAVAAAVIGFAIANAHSPTVRPRGHIQIHLITRP